MLELVHFFVNLVEFLVLPGREGRLHNFKEGSFLEVAAVLPRNNLQPAMIRCCDPKKPAVEMESGQSSARGSHSALGDVLSACDDSWDFNRPVPIFERRIVAFRKNERVQDSEKIIEGRREEAVLVNFGALKQLDDPSTLIGQLFISRPSQVQL